MKHANILLALLLLGPLLKAQNNDGEINQKMKMWVSYGSASYGSVLQFQMYAKRSSWGLGQQFFAANVRNASMYKLHVTGELYAKLICGNESVSKLDFVIDKYESLQKAEMGALNTSFLSDATGLINSADKELCSGDDIIIGGKKYGVNRIKSLGYRNLKILAQVGEGGDWVAMNSQGTLMEKPNSSASIQNTPNDKKQTAVNNTQTASGYTAVSQQSQTTNNTNNTALTAQRQQYQNQANYYLNLANNTNQSSISQQLNLDLARTNAYMSGNTQQIQQIQQQQNRLNQQRSDQLAQSTVQFVGSVFNLIQSNQQRKQELQQQSEERQRQWRQEESRKQKIKDAVIQDLEPVKQQSLDFLKQGIELDSIAYLNGKDAMEKLSISASWLLKKKEQSLIESSTPDVYIFSDDTYKINSVGHITPSAIVLLEYQNLADSFALQNLKPEYYTAAKDFSYEVDLPYKAEKNYKTKSNFFYSNRTSVDVLYAKASQHASGNYGVSVAASEVAALDRLDYKPKNKNYGGDFSSVYSYYKGKGWRSIYTGGFWGLKKLDAMRILGNIILDSAVKKQDVATAERAAKQYSKAFNYYTNTFGGVADNKKHPLQLLDKLFLNYATAAMILKKESIKPGSVDAAVVMECIKQYVADFDKYQSLRKEKETRENN